MITAKIVADSINPSNVRLTTYELKYPLSIHGELMTHRVFSRNAASSRAIPFETFCKEVEENPALPVRWGSHQKGMQSGPDLEPDKQSAAEYSSIIARDECLFQARQAHDNGCHKSIVNRWLAPWAHITTIVTATELGFRNFFALRAHIDAEPNFQVLAYKMLKLYLEQKPQFKQWKEWHIPYDEMNNSSLTIEERIKIAVARCCWVSYNKPGKNEFDLADAISRHDSAAKSGHWSPFEHVAQATKSLTYLCSNFEVGQYFSSWLQYRKQFRDECKNPNLLQILNECPEWIKRHLEDE